MRYSSRVRTLPVLLVLAFACALVFAQPAMADDVFVDPLFGSDVTGDGSVLNPYATLGTSIGAATSGDTVWAAAGTYSEDVTLTTGVDVIGVDDTVCTIQGTGMNSVVSAVSVTDVTLSDFTITGGSATTGGGIWSVLSVFEIADCTITGNDAIDWGGGIQTSLSTPTITGCDISGNTAGSGGGIALEFSPATITDCDISGSSVTTQGGGLYIISGSDATITDCDISMNTAGSGNGGGVFCDASDPVFADCSIEDNGALGSGGGISYEATASPELTNCYIGENTASYGGGVAGATGGSASFTDCSIVDNSSVVDNGAGLYVNAAVADIGSSDISGNVAAGAGGGSYCTSGTVAIDNSTVWGNTSASQGGGVMVATDGMVSLTDSAITENQSVVGGGLQASYSGSQMTVENCTIAQNDSSGNGGGVNVTFGANLDMDSSAVASNTAGGSGGGFRVESSSASIVNSTVTSNTAVSNGGALFSRASGTTFTNSTLAYNMAGGAGDGIRSVVGTVTIENGILWGNYGDDVSSNASGAFDVIFSNVEEGVQPGPGNISSNPSFVSAATGDLHLNFGSPSIDTASDVFAPPSDKDGTYRPLDGTNDGVAISDMGAYEYAAASPHSTLEPDDTWMNASVTVTITASDDTSIAATYYRENAGAVTTYTAPFLVSAAGTTTIDFWSVDNVGNIEPTQTADIRIDLVDPVTIDDSPPGWVNYDVDLALMATDDMSGVALTEWWTDAAPMPEVYMGPIEISVEGTHNVYYRSTDVAGNVEVTRTATVGIDKTDPWSWDDTPMDWQSAPFDVTIEASDTVSGISSIDVTLTAPSGVTTSTAMSELTTVTVSEDGTTTIEYMAYDNAGNSDGPWMTWAYLDTTEPTVSVTVDPAGWSSTSVTVTIEATDTLSGMDEILYWVDGFGPTIYQGPFQISAEGTTTIDAQAYDNVGNVGLASADTLIDYTAPLMSDDAPSGWQSGDVTVTVEMTDTASGLGANRIFYDNPPNLLYMWNNWMTPGPATFSNSQPISWEGTTTLAYWAQDIVGNVATTQTTEILIDKSDPNVAISTETSWSSMPVTVTIEASDTVSAIDEILYWIDGAGPSIYQGPFQISAEGTHTIDAQAYDLAGNVGLDSATVKLDYTAPTMMDDAPAGWQTTDTSVTVTMMDALSGMGTWQVNYDNPPDFWHIPYVWSAPESHTAEWTHLVTWEGTTTLTYSSTDWVGNQAATQTAQILVDKTPPSTTPTYPAGWQTMDILFSLSATDNASGVDMTYYRVDGGTMYAYSAPFLISKDGTTTVEYWSVDVAGNVEPTQTATVLIDHDPPMTSDDCPTEWQAAPFTVTATATDGISGVAGFNATVTPPPPGIAYTMTAPNATMTANITDDGTTTVEYTFTDVAGNSSAPVTCLALLDTTYPSIDVTASTAWSSMPVTVTITATDTPSGVDMIEYATDGGDMTPYVGPFEQALEGVHEVMGYATDMAGNTTTATVMTYTDYTPPVTTDDALDVYSGIANFTLTAVDTPGAGASASSGVAYTQWRVDGSAWTTGTAVSVEEVGDHTVEYRSVDMVGNTEAVRSVEFHVFADGSYKAIRIWDNDRYTTAVKTAHLGFDPDNDGSWPGVTHVIIASGEDRALADPLASAGLVWAYDAPLFLINSDFVPAKVNQSISQIAAANGPVTVHVVGGTFSVPNARLQEIDAAVSGPLTFDRLLTGGDRFDMAAAIAGRVTAEWQVRHGAGTAPDRVLVANGADADTFFDALALSPIAASEGYPILLVGRNAVPSATNNAINAITPIETIIGGGPNTVSNGVQGTLGATRWWGPDRYTNALAIADNAVTRTWLSRKVTGVSAKLPDALSSGGVLGRMDGVSVITNGQSLTPNTRNWLSAHKGQIEDCYVFGGTASITGNTKAQIENALR